MELYGDHSGEVLCESWGLRTCTRFQFHEDATGGQLAEVVTTRPYVMKFAHSTPTQTTDTEQD